MILNNLKDEKYLKKFFFLILHMRQTYNLRSKYLVSMVCGLRVLGYQRWTAIFIAHCKIWLPGNIRPGASQRRRWAPAQVQLHLYSSISCSYFFHEKFPSQTEIAFLHWQQLSINVQDMIWFTMSNKLIIEIKQLLKVFVKNLKPKFTLMSNLTHV